MKPRIDESRVATCSDPPTQPLSRRDTTRLLKLFNCRVRREDCTKLRINLAQSLVYPVKVIKVTNDNYSKYITTITSNLAFKIDDGIDNLVVLNTFEEELRLIWRDDDTAAN